MAIPASNPAISATGDLYAKWTVGAVVFFVGLEIGYLIVVGLPPFAYPAVDGSGYVLGRDFLNTWMGGRSFFTGGPAAWFDFEAYNAMLRGMLGVTHYPEHLWSYPPHIVLLIWPFGLLPYLLAYGLWCVTGIAAYLLACPASVRRGKLLFLAAAPGVAICVFTGQNGFFTAALLIGGLVNLDRRPILAGILFGILTIKPQLGLMLPIMLFLSGRWRVIASAVATTGLLVAATSWMFGFGVWTEFFNKVVPTQAVLLDHGHGLLFATVPTAYFGARLLGFPQAAGAVQAVFSGFAVLAVIWTFYRRRDSALSIALLVTATFLATPYILNYDMVVFGFVVALLRDRPDNSAADHWLGLAVWTLPASMILIALANIPLGPIVLTAFAGRLLWRLARSEKAAGESKVAAAVAAA